MFSAFATEDEDVVGDGGEAGYEGAGEMANWTEEEAVYKGIEQRESDAGQDDG